MLSLNDVYDLVTLLKFCSLNLGWKIEEDYFEDVDELTFDYTPEDLGMNPDDFSKIRKFRQLRPLVEDQPWGIFAVDFESKRLDVTALRKILHGLLPHHNTFEQKTWKCNHLLFLCFWGESIYRTIGFIAFEKKTVGLPTMKALYCTPKIEDRIHLENFISRIEHLAWPVDLSDSDSWVSKWHEAFTGPKGQVIRDVQLLTQCLAEKAQSISTTIESMFKIENSQGSINRLYHRFSCALNIELSHKDFADMYAQTLVYGLFSARCMNPKMETLNPSSAIACVPNTNPLLKQLLFECVSPTGEMHFDELEVSDLIDLLNNMDVKSILADFNRQTGYGKEDPVVYFYERFLDIYEKEQKKRRGVYYTPTPVVEFMVRAVSYFLKNDYSCPKGFCENSVSILDPATGTGTFLRRIIFEINDEFKKADNDNKGIADSVWTDYVKSSLLKRLYGFEFMMAPYAVAHMKLAMALKDTGYEFPLNHRLQVYLANALINSDTSPSPVIIEDPLYKESSYAAAVKKSEIDVIIGNPPYRTDSENKDSWIMQLMEDYKKEPDSQERLKERNPKVINEDSVKFIRFAQEVLKSRDNAIIAYITPHSYTDNLTFRGMRWVLLNSFDAIYILDLHGNVMSRESSESGERDENIFDIQQGVCISLFIKNQKKYNRPAQIFYSDLYGSRNKKYEYLVKTKFEAIAWKRIIPEEPNYFFKPKDLSQKSSYDKGLSLSEIFPISIGGIKTHDDAALVSTNPFDTGFDQPYDYRPFDVQHINYDLSKVKRGRYEVMKHFLGHPNLGLVINRQVVTDNWSHIQIVENMIDNRLHYSHKGIPVVCPMYLYDDAGNKKANINADLMHAFETATDLVFSEELTDVSERFDIRDLFDYSYAILNSTAYRAKYATLLSINFPRVPLPPGKKQFLTMAGIGSRLRNLHMMKTEVPNSLGICFIGEGNRDITRIRYLNDVLEINNTQSFIGIRDDLWNFYFGGYHGLQKWFKDRRGTKMTENDITHVITVFNIFEITQNIMGELDVLLVEYGLI